MLRIPRLGPGWMGIALITLLACAGPASGQESFDWDTSTLARFTAPSLTLDAAEVLATAAPAAEPAAPEAVASDPEPVAPEPPVPAEAAGPGSVQFDLLKTSRLTGDWFGLRTELEKVGINFSPMWVGAYEQNFSGGANTRNACDWAGYFFYNLELDFGKMNLVPGATFFIRANQTYNDGIRPDVGSVSQPYWVYGSSGDRFYGDSNCILVDKWWYRQRLLDDRLEFRLGKLLNLVDLFDQNAYAGNYTSQFSNQALNYSANNPIRKGIGAYLKIWPTDWLYFAASAVDPDARATRTGFDTAFHGRAHFHANWEFGLTPKLPSAKGALPGNYRFGWWFNPRSQNIYMDTLGGALRQDARNGDVGFYLSFDQMIWKENDDPADKQGLGAFLRYGYAHEDVNLIEHAWSMGAQYQGLIPSRDADVLAFGVAQSILSKQYRSEIQSLADRETVYEMYYAITITPWCVITPDVQVITNPGGNKDARDAVVGGVRIKVTF